MPPVRRFNPLPMHAGATLASTTSEEEMTSGSPFPGFGNPRQQRRADGSFVGATGRFGAGHISGGVAEGSDSRTTVSLRPSNWTRAPPGRDQLYSEDDFASADDVQSGKRRWAPPAPTTESRGSVLAAARRRFEREWKTELESVDDSRSVALDIRGKPDQGTANRAGSSRDRHLHDVDDKEQSRAGLRLQSGKKVMLPYIGKKGLRPIPRGVGSWRLLGRPPAKILKKQKAPDVAKVFGVSRQMKRRRRNTGSGLDFDEASDKWMNWYNKNKRRNFDKVLTADSPKRDDVEAAYEDRFQRRQQQRPKSEGRDRANELSELYLDE